MQEKRKSERRKLVAFTPVYDSHKNILGYLGDLTLQGARLIGGKLLEVDTQVTLVIDFPATPELSAKRVTLPARVIWSGKESDTGYFNTGFEFQALDRQNRTVIEAILERYQFRRPMRA